MSRQVHLLVLIHGLWGSPAHLATCKEEAIKAHAAAPAEEGIELEVLVPTGNEGTLTYDGFDVLASRVGYEVDKRIEELEALGSKVVLFSVMGYSLGGLVARCLLPLLHSRTPSFFSLHPPCSFSTIATPHIGIPLYSGSFWGAFFNTLGSRLLSRTGEQLYGVDRWEEGGRCLLEVMSDPDEIFLQSLNLFPTISIFANAVQDRTVPYPTASFSLTDPFVAHDLPSQLEELVVETDADGIITKYYSVPISEEAAQEGEGEKRGWWSLSRKKMSGGGKRERGRKEVQKRPFLPPFLQFRFPLNYLFYLVTPIMIPIFLTFILSRFLLDSSRSRKRLSLLSKQLHPSSTPTPSSLTDGTSTTSPFQPSGLSVDNLRKLLAKAETRFEGGVVRGFEDAEEDMARAEDGVVTGRASPSGVETPVESEGDAGERRCLIRGKGSKSPESSAEAGKKDDGKGKSKTPRVLLTDAQTRMVNNLNTFIRPEALRKYLTWYPRSHNSHALIVVRDPKTFPMHEEGRPAVRRWAETTVPKRKVAKVTQ